MLVVSNRHKQTPLAKLKRIRAEMVEARNNATGSYHKEVNHANLLACLSKNLESLGHKPGEPSAFTALGGGNLIASIECKADGNRTYGLGVTSSIIGRGGLRVWAGASYPNGAVLIAECLAGSRYCGTFDLEVECRSLVLGWAEAIKTIEPLERGLKACRLYEGDCSRVLMHCGTDRVLKFSAVGKAEALYRSQPDLTAFDMLAAVSLAVRETQVKDQLHRLFRFRKFLTQKSNRSAA